MKKQYIRMNNNDEYLSLGNLFRIIKDSSKNKVSALQSEIFCVLFEIDGINDTTVNNYCVGCRSIGGEYKQIFLNKQKRYQSNREEFVDSIIGILSIIDGVIYNVDKKRIEFIDSSETALNLARKLYNLAKNDKQVIYEFTNKLYCLLEKKKVYECLVLELCFIVLERKQPLFEEELKIEVFENVLNDTSISSLDLQEYLSLKLREGINFDYSMKSLAAAGNAYANFELGSNEYYGFFSGEPRYDEAFKYLDKAASLNHASANYMIGNMLIQGLLGNRSEEELKRGYEYLVKSYELGNIAASNLIGNMYLNGIYPLKKDKDKAIEYYLRAASKDYAFALNNLGKVKENEDSYDEAFAYYLKSADLGESWACNKVGEYYRKGIIEKDMKKAYDYYRRALESNYRTRCYYAYYNLAKYFYKNGFDDIGIDKYKYLSYLEIASSNNIVEASLELLEYYVIEYKTNSEVEDKIVKIIKRVESNKLYNEKVRLVVEDLLSKKIDKIDISLLRSN